MNSKIDQIILPDDLSNYLVAGVRESYPLLAGLSTFNFFVGSNNSGKSRLLRRIAAAHPLIGTLSSYPKELRKFRLTVLSSIEQHGEMNDLLRLKGLLENLEFQTPSTQFEQAKDGLINHLHNFGLGFFDSSHIRTIINLIYTYENTYDKSLFSDSIYIPTLRGLRPFTNNENNDHYKSRTLDDYFNKFLNGKSLSVEIYTGLTFYHDLRNLLLGDHTQRSMAREFESFLSQELFGGEQITLIPRESSDVVYFKIGFQEERPIHEVGDGLQHLIILTFPLFKRQSKPNQVFIEEPELFLHPGMQRALIKAMRTFRNNQYFIATHSNHFLDLTLEFDDISIYSLRRSPKPIDHVDTHFEITLVSSHDFRVLEELGTRSSSVFLSNCTIWVEGITDRRYLAHYLRLYQDHLEETRDSIEGNSDNEPPVFSPRQDLHYSFVEYSGGNITHWSFLDQIDDPILVDRLCSKAMLVTDKDKGKDKRHKALKEKMLKRYHCLPCLEIENLLSPDVLREILKKFGEDESQIRDFKHSDYLNIPLGGFLNDLLPSKKRVGSYGEKSKSGAGTVTNKLKFSELAIKAMPTKEEASLKTEKTSAFGYKQLTLPAQHLAKEIYNFIKDANQS